MWEIFYLCSVPQVFLSRWSFKDAQKNTYWWETFFLWSLGSSTKVKNLLLVISAASHFHDVVIWRYTKDQCTKSFWQDSHLKMHKRTYTTLAIKVKILFVWSNWHFYLRGKILSNKIYHLYLTSQILSNKIYHLYLTSQILSNKI